jgi:hypothetical protein
VKLKSLLMRGDWKMDAVSEVGDSGSSEGCGGDTVGDVGSSTCWGRDWAPLPWDGEREVFLCCTNQERADQLRAEANEHRQHAAASGIASAAAAAAAAASGISGDVGSSIMSGSAAIGTGAYAMKEGYEAGRKEREADQIERGEDEILSKVVDEKVLHIL